MTACTTPSTTARTVNSGRFLLAGTYGLCFRGSSFEPRYIIAAGGAGSSGRPALARGTLISTRLITPITANQPGRGKDADVSPPPLWGVVVPSARLKYIGGPANDAADKDRERCLERQVHAHRHEHRTLDLEHDHRDAHQDADDDEWPG